MFDLHVIAQQATPWLERYGYVAVAVGVGIEGVGIPLPGATLMGGAALLAGQGEMNLAAVLLTAWMAAVVGDNLGYWLGRRGGHRLLLRSGVNRHRLARLHRFYERFGIALILFGRFFDGTRQLNGLVAGSAAMPWPRFAAAEAIGAALWVGFWVVGLYTLDHHLAQLHGWIARLNPWVAASAVLLLVTVLLALYRHRRGGDRP